MRSGLRAQCSTRTAPCRRPGSELPEFHPPLMPNFRPYVPLVSEAQRHSLKNSLCYFHIARVTADMLQFEVLKTIS